MRHSLSGRSLAEFVALRVTPCFVFVVELHDHFAVFGFEAHAHGEPVGYHFAGHGVEGFEERLLLDDGDAPLDVYLVALFDDPGLHTFSPDYFGVDIGL